MPDRALRPFVMCARRSNSAVRKPPMPDRALRLCQCVHDCAGVKEGQKTPNARQGITTYRIYQLPKTLIFVRKPPMPDRALRLFVPVTPMATERYVRKPPMPDRALRHPVNYGVHQLLQSSENPQCPTGPKQLTMAQ